MRDRFNLNIDTQTGVIYKGMIFYADKHMYITGDELEKMGEKTYRIREGSLTSCDGPVPDWKITGKRSEVTLEGYGKIWGGAFWIRDFPVFYLPFGMFPARTKRASGFLFPLVGASDTRGFRFKTAYFWAINRSTDATFSADIMTDRGVMGGLEYRYFLKKDLRGELAYNFIEDSGITNPNTTESEHGFRWWLDAYHQQTLPGDVQALVDINLVSDDTFFEDFADDINLKTAPYLESKVSLLKEWYPGSLILDASWFENLNDLTNSDRSTVQRLPRLSAFVRPLSIFGSPLAFDMDASATNFYREEGLRGYRLEANPRLTANIATGYFSVTPWVEGNLAWWWLEGDDAFPSETDRATYTTGVEVSTYLARTYPRDSGPYSYIRHIIKPVVGYRYSPPLDEGAYPYFDELDRVRSSSLLYVSLVNRILARRGSADGGGASDELLYAEIGAGIDFEPDIPWLGYTVTSPHVISYFELRFSPSSYITVRGKGRFDHELERFLYLSTDLLVKDARGDSASLGYVIESDVIYPKQYEHLFGSMKMVVNDNIDLGVGARYSFDEGDLRYLSGTVNYHRQCWGIGLTVYNNRHPEETQPNELGFFVTVTLSGLGTIPSIDLGQTKY